MLRQVLRGQVKRFTADAELREQIPTTLQSFPSDFSMDLSNTRVHVNIFFTIYLSNSQNRNKKQLR
jgi:hypothetical protein